LPGQPEPLYQFHFRSSSIFFKKLFSIESRVVNKATHLLQEKYAFTSSAIPLQGRDARLKLGYLDFAPCKGRVLALGECG
jgi:hypothetical protein